MGHFITSWSNFLFVFFASASYGLIQISLLPINSNPLTRAIQIAIKPKQTEKFYNNRDRNNTKKNTTKLAPINNKIIKYFMFEIYRSGFVFCTVFFYVVFAIKRNMVGLPFGFFFIKIVCKTMDYNRNVAKLTSGFQPDTSFLYLHICIMYTKCLYSVQTKGAVGVVSHQRTYQVDKANSHQNSHPISVIYYFTIVIQFQSPLALFLSRTRTDSTAQTTTEKKAVSQFKYYKINLISVIKM
jgi:hypothetical protein